MQYPAVDIIGRVITSDAYFATTTKPKFRKGSKVILNPFGNLGQWNWVDRELKYKGTAKVVDIQFFVPSEADIQSGAPRNGYWQYKLVWRVKEGYPKYPIPEPFLFRANSKEANDIRSWYRVTTSYERLNNKFKDMIAKLETSLSEKQSKIKRFQ